MFSLNVYPTAPKIQPVSASAQEIKLIALTVMIHFNDEIYFNLPEMKYFPACPCKSESILMLSTWTYSNVPMIVDFTGKNFLVRNNG